MIEEIVILLANREMRTKILILFFSILFQSLDRERNFFGQNISDSFNTSTRSTSNYVTSSSNRNDHSNLVQRQTSNQLNTWLDDINSPLVQDTNDGKLLKLRFDVTQYLPEEIVVKTVDNRLQVK